VFFLYSPKLSVPISKTVAIKLNQRKVPNPKIDGN
jgi:hypothetical protein